MTRERIVLEFDSPNPERGARVLAELVCSHLNRHGELTVYGNPIEQRRERFNPTSDEWEPIR